MDVLCEKDGKVVVYFKSCEAMTELEDGSVHLICTSPPYLAAKGTESWASYSEYLKFVEKVLRECYRVLKPGRVLAWNICDYIVDGERYPLAADSIQIGQRAGFRYQDDIVWVKPDGMMSLGSSNRCGNFLKRGWPLYFHPDNRYEHIILFRKGKMDYEAYPDKSYKLGTDSYDRHRTYRPWLTDVWEFHPVPASQDNRHPLEYPDELCYNIMLFYSLPGEVVLDPFTGSGTTGKVAFHLGRKFVGYEVNPDKPVVAVSSKTGEMTVPMCNRELIKWKIEQPLSGRIRDSAQVKCSKISDF